MKETFLISGIRSASDVFVGQAQFDAENFVNEAIQNYSDISSRYISLRDYDMQAVDVSGLCFTE